jgi:branched-chain amino acid transport system permease protein
MMRIRDCLKWNYTLPIVITIILAIMPHVLGFYWLNRLIHALWLVYLCSAWNIAFYAGYFSLGHSLFIGAGAYTSTFLWLRFGISPWLGMLLGGLVGTLLALGIGGLCLRFKLPILSFVIMTLAFSLIGTYAVEAMPSLGSDIGLFNSFTTSNPLNFQWVSNIPYYYIILAMAIGAIMLSRFIFRSRAGLRFRALAENPRMAVASGIDERYGLIALSASAFLAAMGGTFWAQHARFICPATVLGAHLSITIAMLTVIGGAGSLWGPVVAPAVLAPLTSIFRAELGSKYAGIDSLVYGVIIVAILLYFRKGILTWLGERRAQAKQRLQERRVVS